jgi:hypothetical protein
MVTPRKSVGGTWLRPVLFSLSLCAAAHAQPDTAWLFTYPASEFGESQPLAAFVDDTGNVYVAGWSQKKPEHPGVLLLKIDSLGHLVWERTSDNVTAVSAARDTGGDIYIAGSSTDTSGRLHVLKYSPSGNLVWDRSYGEAHRRFKSWPSIAIDDSQNVYACGKTDSADCGIVSILKYRSDGVLMGVLSYTLGRSMSLLWGNRFHILKDGGAYLAMSIAPRPEYWPCRRLIVRLSSQGRVLWERVYRNEDSTWDDIKWSQVDDNANIYVTGTATRPAGYSTVKMDSSGKVVWSGLYWYSQNTEGGPGFLMLQKGNVYVASGRDTVRLVKYDSLGSQQWLNKYGSGETELGYEEEGYDEPNPDFCCMNVDDSGNVYITGDGLDEYSTGKGHAVDSLFAFLVKYDSQGRIVWQMRRPWTNMRPDGLFDVDWGGAIVGLDKKGALYDIGVNRVLKDSWRFGIYVLKYRTR